LIIQTQIHVPDTHGESGCGELTSLVSLLIEGLRRRGDDDEEASPDSWRAAEQALTAARQAERHIVGLRQKIARLERLAVTDELTGLLNRRGFVGQLGRVLGLAQRHGDTGLLVFIDLDGFKRVNDTYGHAAGDDVLRHVARFLERNVRSTDIVGRLGGDEFALVLTPASPEGAKRRARQIETLLNAEIVTWGGHAIPIQASVGGQVYGSTDDAEALLARADASMYSAKRLRTRTPQSLCVA
jgi:diguanylate cyclase (GGDEF)-like protein